MTAHLRFGSVDVVPVDHEIVSAGVGTNAEVIGDFRDTHRLTDTGAERLVAGYLMLDRDRDGSVLVASHGRLVGRLDEDELGWAITATAPFEPRGDDALHAVAAGFAVVPAPGQIPLVAHGDVIRLAEGVRFAIVHGPAPEKVTARIALLSSLRSIGGRHD